MEKPKAIVKMFPVNKSRLYYWAVQYVRARAAQGVTAADLLIDRTVPEQLHKQVYALVRMVKVRPKE